MFYGDLTTQDVDVGPEQKDWITQFMNQISAVTLYFVWKVMCVYKHIFQQEKYGIRQVILEVNIVNNERLLQGKLRNDFTFTHVYCVPPKCHWPDLYNKLPV